MDDIYGDLENYNDVNALQELRNENMALNSQMQEKSLQIDKLQKDFDKLTSDYKKLEINYSSLLKTARAEVERKTQMINNLNAEKDMMVLNTIQNCKSISNIRRNLTRDRVNSFKKNKKNYDSDDGGKANKNSKDMRESMKIDPAKNRNEENRLPSIDTVSSTNTDDTNKQLHTEQKQANLESYVEDNGESKENIARVKPRAQSIRNRRKSMPVPSKQSAKISSDEDDDNHSLENTKRKDWIPKEDKNRKVFDRNYNDKQSHKVSETSGIDDKYSSHHESSKETCYKNKHNRYGDKYRSAREKYDPMQRHRKHFSPERSHRRMQRDDRLPRSEYGRHRVLQSPPFERYDQRRRKDRERRPNCDKENPEDRHTKRRYETHAVNHKAQSDCDEPKSKRARTDSFNRRPEDDKRQCKENEIADRPMTHRTFENLQDISCQSPDYVHSDTDSTHRVREIMDIAATHLEDPRLTSKKYITKTEDDKVMLSTVDGRNVDLKVVDTSTWDILRVDVPEALQRPPGYSDEIVREVHMDIDNPVSNLSMESGEIHSETNDASFMDNVTESYFNEYEIARDSQKSFKECIVDVQRKETKGLFDYENVTKSSKITKNAEDYMKYNKQDGSSFHDSGGYRITPQKETDISVNYEKPAKSTKNYIEDNENERSRTDTRHIDVNDKATGESSQQNIRDHIVNAQETENLPKLGNPTKTSKYKIPKVKKPEKYTVPESVTSDVIKPLGRLLDEFNSTTKADKKPQENEKKSKRCDTNKLSSKQDVEKCLDIDNVHQHDDFGDEQYICQIRKQAAFREVVEGDLELSDETSDNIELKTQGKSKFECIGQPSPKHTDENEMADDKWKKGGNHAKNKKTEQCSNNLKIIIKRVSEEKTEEPIYEGSKKQKTKKKSHKHKGGKETSKSKEIEETTDKIPNKEETPKEIKAKFTDLFGDSSSLITPEDLGVITAPTQSPYPEKYVSIFEDAQDAIDVNVKEICKMQTSSNNSSNDDAKVEVKLKANSIRMNKAGTDSKKKRSKKSRVDKSVPIMDTVEPSNRFLNLIPDAVAKDPDVVNTVIISTGVQPQVARAGFVEPDAGKQIKNNLVNVIEKSHNTNDVAALIHQLPFALATSTPSKELKNIQVEADTRMPEFSASSSHNKVITDDVSSPAASISNGLDTQNEADAPDVRIFVKRRRKVLKKT